MVIFFLREPIKTSIFAPLNENVFIFLGGKYLTLFFSVRIIHVTSWMGIFDTDTNLTSKVVYPFAKNKYNKLDKQCCPSVSRERICARLKYRKRRILCSRIILLLLRVTSSSVSVGAGILAVDFSS